MKRLFLISAMWVTATACWAQSQCSNDPLFNFGNTTSPKEINKLGTAPEFPFLRNKANAAQFLSALKRNDDQSTQGMSQLNQLLMGIGFANGAKDVEATNISSYYIPSGTEGNMGSSGYSTAYYRLSGDASEFKAWKIASNNGCYLYILAKCGNAFYPNSGKKTAGCFNVPVSIVPDSSNMTITSTGQKITSTDNVYVYYHRKRHKRHETEYAMADIPDPYPSKPLLLSTTDKVDVVPETYKVTVNAANNDVTVCPDSTLNVAANIGLERTSSYTGYYPAGPKKEYKLVSKHAYKKSTRKMRRIHHKEERVAKLTGVPVVKKCSS